MPKHFGFFGFVRLEFFLDCPQQPCHASLDMCESGHLWLRHHFLIKQHPFRRQQVFLPWMAGLVGI